MNSSGQGKTQNQNELVESHMSQVLISSPVISGFSFRQVVGEYCPSTVKTGMVQSSLRLLKYERK